MNWNIVVGGNDEVRELQELVEMALSWEGNHYDHN